VVWNPNVAGSVGSLAYWSIADATDEAHREGQIVYRPYKGPSKNQLTAEKTGQGGVHKLDAEVQRLQRGGTRRSNRSWGRAREARRALIDFSQAKSVLGAISRAAA
jgi:hypothetical protein